MICSICGEDKTEEEMSSNDICLDCASAMLQKDGIDMGLGEDFF